MMLLLYLLYFLSFLLLPFYCSSFPIIIIGLINIYYWTLFYFNIFVDDVTIDYEFWYYVLLIRKYML